MGHLSRSRGNLCGGDYRRGVLQQESTELNPNRVAQRRRRSAKSVVSVSFPWQSFSLVFPPAKPLVANWTALDTNVDKSISFDELLAFLGTQENEQIARIQAAADAAITQVNAQYKQHNEGVTSAYNRRVAPKTTEKNEILTDDELCKVLEQAAQCYDAEVVTPEPTTTVPSTPEPTTTAATDGSSTPNIDFGWLRDARNNTGFDAGQPRDSRTNTSTTNDPLDATVVWRTTMPYQPRYRFDTEVEFKRGGL